MIKRAMISGLNGGIDVADLRVSPRSAGVLKTQARFAAAMRRLEYLDPEAVFIRIYEPPRILLTPGLQKEIEKNFTRQELRRVAAGGIGSVVPGPGARNPAQDLLDSLDMAEIRERHRIVVDYGYSAASFDAPARRRPAWGRGDLGAAFAEELGERESLAQAIGHTKRP